MSWSDTGISEHVDMSTRCTSEFHTTESVFKSTLYFNTFERNNNCYQSERTIKHSLTFEVDMVSIKHYIAGSL